jgi:YHS domain-containing protein
MYVRKAVLLSITVLVAFSLSANVVLAQQEQSGKPADSKQKEGDPAALPKCPVSGEPVNLYVSLATDEGPVYFCCTDCVGKYKAAPKDFAEKVAAQRAALAKLPKVQVTCPVSGKPVDKQQFSEYKGEKVYFCCPDCKPKFDKDPSAFKAKLAASYIYQTKCPVMGGDIDPAVFVDLPTKERVYFCCPMCNPKFTKEPDKYAPKLAVLGYKLDLAKLKQAAGADKKDAKK